MGAAAAVPPPPASGSGAVPAAPLSAPSPPRLHHQPPYSYPVWQGYSLPASLAPRRPPIPMAPAQLPSADLLEEICVRFILTLPATELE
jgi:hypothetical protein